MQSRHEEFARYGVEVVAVSFVNSQRLAEYLRARPTSIRLLSDPDRHAYRAFGLESAPWRRLLRPSAILEYMKLILRGRLPRLPKEDVHQLGGDFLLDATGRVVYSFRSEDPVDRPDVSELLAVAKQLVGK